MTVEETKRLRKIIRDLRARVKDLEAEVICADCGHTHGKHLEAGEDGPCYGDDATCMCAGFIRREPR